MLTEYNSNFVVFSALTTSSLLILTGEWVSKWVLCRISKLTDAIVFMQENHLQIDNKFYYNRKADQENSFV